MKSSGFFTALIIMVKYFKIFILALVHSIKNYKALIGLNLFVITCLIIFAHLWQATTPKMGTAHLHPDRLLWYIALNEWVLIALPIVQRDMEQDLRSGKLACLLVRPISYLGATFSNCFGILCVNLASLGLVAFIFTYWQVGFPFHFFEFTIFIILGVIAGSVGILYQMLVGISAFWLKEVAPFNWIWDKFLFTFGGLIIPLSIYPDWIQQIAFCTPFPGILGQRSSLALDFDLTQALQIAGSLFWWGIFAVVCLILLYRKGLRILHIEGG